MAITDVPVQEIALPSVTAGGTGMPRLRRRRLRSILVSYLATLFFIVNLNFFLPRVLPGNALAVMIGGATASRGTSEVSTGARAQLAHYYGFDRPLVAQYGQYMADLAHGDLGTSIHYNTPVRRLMRDRLRWSLLLVVSSMVLATVIGMAAGVHSGWRRGQRLDRGFLGTFVLVGNFPVYVIASFALVVLGVKVHWFPLGGAQTAFVNYGVPGRILDIARHVALPAAVMALQFVFLEYLVMRGGVVSELGSDHLLLGRAKGLRDRRLKYRYAARNALLPVVTVVALNVGAAAGASIFVERIFAYPGLGGLMFDSIGYRDYPAMQGCFLVISLAVLGVNLFTDLLYPRLDPRVGR